MADETPAEFKKRFNAITTWRQGAFIDGKQYSKWTAAEKAKAQFQESHLVRSGPKENPLCQAPVPEMAEWIAERLNLCARLEALAVQMLDGASDLDVWESLKELRSTGKL